MKCFNCGEIGHPAERCPLYLRAASLDEHLARCDRFVQRWVDGEISMEAKRKAISAENILWYGEGHPDLRARRLTWPQAS